MDTSRINLILLSCFTNACDSKINDLDKKIFLVVRDLVAEQNIFQFKIPMNNSPGVTVVDRVDYLDYDFARFYLI